MSQLSSLGARAFGGDSNGAAEGTLTGLQAKLSRELPPSLHAIIKEFDGASVIFDKEVSYKPLTSSKWTRPDGSQSLEMLFGLNEGESGLAAQYNRYQGRIPDDVIPIGEGPGGNLVCLAVHGSKKGCIYFWDHEDERSMSGVEENNFGNLFLVANSFEDFLRALTADDPEPQQDDGITEAWLSDDL